MDTIFWHFLKKNTKDCNLRMNLEQLISQIYSVDKMDEFKEPIIQVDALRRATFFKNKTPSSKNEHLSFLTNYYLQLIDIDTIFVDCTYGFTQNFTWYHSYEKSSIAGKYRKAVSKELNFEIANVLFNLLAEICNKAHNVDFDSTEDLNSIQKDFVLASGGFQYLATYSNSHNVHQLLDDLLPFVLNIYSILCLAHAHEIIFIKSILAKKPNQLTASIASQVQLLYGQCVSNVKSLKTSQGYIKELQKFLEAKSNLFKAFTNYYQGLFEIESSKKLEHYSRCIVTRDLLNKLDLINIMKINFFKNTLSAIRGDIDRVIEEHEKFEIGKPLSSDSLSSVSPQRILEAKKFSIDQITSYLTHTEYTNLFDGLSSIAVINLTRFFELTKKNFILNHENEIHKNKKAMEKEFLAMHVPYRFESYSDGFPPSIIKCIDEYRKYGGLLALQDNIDKVTEIQNFNVDMIESMRSDIRRAKEINRYLLFKYHHIQNQIDMTETINQHNSSVCYYFSKLEQTHNTDERLMTNFQRALKGLEFLNKSESEMIMGINLEKSLDLTSSDETRELKLLNELYDSCCNLNEERYQICKEMARTDDFKDEITFIIREYPVELHSFKVEEAIKESLEPLTLKLKQTYSKQDEIIQLMKETVATLSHSKGLNERTIELFKHITKYYNDFEEISAHIDSSIKWHENFKNTVLHVQDSNCNFIKAYQYQMTEIIGPDANKYFCMNEEDLLDLTSKPIPPNYEHMPPTGPGPESNISAAGPVNSGIGGPTPYSNHLPISSQIPQPIPASMNSGVAPTKMQSNMTAYPSYSNYHSSSVQSSAPAQLGSYSYLPNNGEVNSRQMYPNGRLGTNTANVYPAGDMQQQSQNYNPPASKVGSSEISAGPNRMKTTADLLHSPPTEYRSHHLPPQMPNGSYGGNHNYQNYPVADHSMHLPGKTSKIYDGPTDGTHSASAISNYPPNTQKPGYNPDYKQPAPSSVPNSYNSGYPPNSNVGGAYPPYYNGAFPTNYYPPPNGNTRSGPSQQPPYSAHPSSYSSANNGYPVYQNSSYMGYPPPAGPQSGPYPPYANHQTGYHYPPSTGGHATANNQYPHPSSTIYGNKYNDKYIPR